MILPIYTGLEQLPQGLLDASSDLGARARATSGRSCCRWCCLVAAGSIFTFSSASAGRLHLGQIVAGMTQIIGNSSMQNII